MEYSIGEQKIVFRPQRRTRVMSLYWQLGIDVVITCSLTSHGSLFSIYGIHVHLKSFYLQTVEIGNWKLFYAEIFSMHSNDSHNYPTGYSKVLVSPCCEMDSNPHSQTCL